MSGYGNLSKEQLIDEIKRLKKGKKFGLLWENKPEDVAELCKTKLPVLADVEDREIANGTAGPTNILIEGDNYHALSVLNYTHKGKIDVIYIDPPYNTGETKEWKFNDKWIDENDTYRHSKWLSFISKRLRLAKNLLADHGTIFISIDENESAQLKILCDEIFGQNNFVEQITWNKRIPKNDKGIGNIHEYILLYVKNGALKHQFTQRKDGLESVYDLLEDCRKKKIAIPETEERLRFLYEKNKYDRGITLYCQVDEHYRIWGKINLCWPNAQTQGPRYIVQHPITKKPVRIPQKGWRWKRETFNKYLGSEKPIKLHDGSILHGSIWFGKDEKTQPSFVQYLDNVENLLLRSILSLKSSGGMELQNILGNDYGMHPKPVGLIKHLLSACRQNEIVLDFFAGSGTTGQTVLEMNKEDGGKRQFILCTNNENKIAEEICYPRVKKVITGYKDSKDEKVEGLGGSLKYFRTDFVDADPTDKNKKKLTEMATEMLCLKEGTFERITNKKAFKIFKNADHYTGIIYDQMAIGDFKEAIAKLKGKFSVYVFSLGDDSFEDEFKDIKQKVKLSPIPEVILRVYRRIFK
ncbi:MAG: site-specific DNA-methyltransferase [Candidatus Omnitrophica bacterium]|nr:site-specific DNA-methyltransferase [Candidatus Omnitrophota bacterium]